MITEEDWKILLEEADNRCLCCGSSDLKLTKDHVIPLAKSGEDIPQNIQPLCSYCNSEKGDEIRDYRGSLRYQGKKEGPSRWYTIKHAANILDKSPSTVRHWIRYDLIAHISAADGKKYVWLSKGISAYQLSEVDDQLADMENQLHGMRKLVSNLLKEKTNKEIKVRVPREIEEWGGR